MILNKPVRILKLLALASLLVACKAKTDLGTDVKITDGWVRENAPGQSVGAAYMTLNSPKDSTLVYVETPAAGSVEIHSMSMENNVMKMRMLEELPLKAGKPEKLAPGGFHLMLFDLKKPLKAGESATFKLCFEDKVGNITHQDVILPVKSAD
jgi:periplasmic copper chaperone A